MSENYTLYTTKMAELRALRAARRPLSSQLDELLFFVVVCELQWDSLAGTDGRSDSIETL